MSYAPSPPSGAKSTGRPSSAKARNEERAKEVLLEAGDVLLNLMAALEGDIDTNDTSSAGEARQTVRHFQQCLGTDIGLTLKEELTELLDQLNDGLAMWDEAYTEATSGVASRKKAEEERIRQEEELRREAEEKDKRERQRREAKARMDALKEKKRLEQAAKEEQDLLKKQLDDARFAREVVEKQKQDVTDWEAREKKFLDEINNLKSELSARPEKQTDWITNQMQEEEKMRAKYQADLESEQEKLEREAREEAESYAKELLKKKEEDMRAAARARLAEKDEGLKKREQEVKELEDTIKEKFGASLDQIRKDIEDAKNAPADDTADEAARAEYEERVAKLENDIDEAREEAKKIDKPLSADEARSEIERFKRMYQKEMAERKKLYNELVDMKGSIRVYVRVRPMKEAERKYRGGQDCTGFPDTEHITVGVNVENTKPKTFEYDRVFEPSCDQPEVFQDTLPVITSVVDGYNVCIFAYGQTGAGKSYTMTGPNSNPGVMKRSLNELFRLLEERKDTEDNNVEVAVLEIYNETIRDLQVPAKEQKKYSIKTDTIRGQYVENLTFTTVVTADDIDDIMGTADSNRSVGKTNMNAHSSRSHMILYIQLSMINRETNRKTVSKLSLIDLAGSERLDKSGAEGKAMLEAQHINKSLSALGDVISSLSHRSKHTPYRNSTLTHLLQDSLGGRAKTLMFANCSPLSGDMAESLSTLQFASRAHGVELGKATKNVANV